MTLRIVVVGAARQRKTADVLSFAATVSEIIAEIKSSTLIAASLLPPKLLFVKYEARNLV